MSEHEQAPEPADQQVTNDLLGTWAAGIDWALEDE